jgi:methylmalonyl-CoA/ethylmalonyl-CoA epimerase
MTARTPGIDGIGQIAVSVQDVDRAARFYEEVLGLRLLFRFPGMAFFDCGGVRLYLTRPETPDVDRTSIIYYRVPDIAAAAASLEARGVSLLGQPHVVHRDDRGALWLAFFKDSEGNHVALMHHAPAGTGA